MSSAYPNGFLALVLTRIIGNFSIYGIRSFLILYFTTTFLFSDETALNMYGAYMSLLYLIPLFGGWLSDQFLGEKKAMLLGGVFAFLGGLLLVFHLEPLLPVGMTFLALGFGIIKPVNISAVGHLFKDHHEKDRAYMILYIGMNVGSALGPLFCGFVGYYYGWHYAFLPIGTLVLAASVLSYRVIKIDNNANKQPHNFLKPTALTLCMTLAVYICLRHVDYIDLLLPSIIIIGFGCFGWLYKISAPSDQRKLRDIFTLIIIFSLFCAVFEQTGGAINIFINRYVDKQIMGTSLPTELFHSFNPLFVIILGSLMKVMKKEQNVYTSFLKGLTCLGISFFILGVTKFMTSGDTVSWVWIALFFVFQVLGELYVVPVGFSTISKLSPKNHKSFVMGMWLVSAACGHYISSFIARTYAQYEGLTTIQSYQTFFSLLSLVVFFIVFLVVTLTRKKSRNLVRKYE